MLLLLPTPIRRPIAPADNDDDASIFWVVRPDVQAGRVTTMTASTSPAGMPLLAPTTNMSHTVPSANPVSAQRTGPGTGGGALARMPSSLRV
jgi:hypothetical protein